MNVDDVRVVEALVNLVWHGFWPGCFKDQRKQQKWNIISHKVSANPLKSLK